jgi:hypothetical protein
MIYTKKTKNPVGRPPLPEAQKAKPISRTIRVPNELSELLKLVVSEYKKGSISLDDVRELARCGMRER